MRRHSRDTPVITKQTATAANRAHPCIAGADVEGDGFTVVASAGKKDALTSRVHL